MELQETLLFTMSKTTTLYEDDCTTSQSDAGTFKALVFFGTVAPRLTLSINNLGRSKASSSEVVAKGDGLDSSSQSLLSSVGCQKFVSIVLVFSQ